MGLNLIRPGVSKVQYEGANVEDDNELGMRVTFIIAVRG